MSELDQVEPEIERVAHGTGLQLLDKPRLGNWRKASRDSLACTEVVCTFLVRRRPPVSTARPRETFLSLVVTVPLVAVVRQPRWS